MGARTGAGLVARASMTGMLVADYADRFPEAIAGLSGWYRSGRLIAQQPVVRGGVGAFPQTLLMLFEGANTGKLVLELTADRQRGFRVAQLARLSRAEGR